MEENEQREALLLPTSSTFKNGIQLANGVPIDRLPLFLDRILNKLAKEEKPFNKVESSKLQEVLGFSSEELQIAVFQDLWMKSGPALVIAFNEKPFGAPGNSQLVDVQWRVHMQVASSNKRQHREPIGILQMNLATTEKGCKTSGGKATALEFLYTELFDFYEKLEKIQEQLDSLS